MPNRILDVVVTEHRFDPAETELRVLVRAAEITPGTQVRGRLMGPRCVYASTVEIAYPFRELARTAEGIVLRVVIPEPSFWDPQSPFLYQGPVELVQDGTTCDRRDVSHGIRHVQLGAKGLRVNGKAVFLNGTSRAPAGDAEARRLHESSNLLVTEAYRERPELWDLADRMGFFVLARVTAVSAFWRWRDAAARHPAALGWVFPPSLLDRELLTAFEARPASGHRPLVGMDLTTFPTSPPDHPFDFILCDETARSAFEGTGLPLLIAVDDPTDARPPGGANVFGRVERAASTA
jgi:hypothetical protein